MLSRILKSQGSVSRNSTYKLKGVCSRLWSLNTANAKLVNGNIWKHRYHASTALNGKVEFMLADIGEGIAEVEVMQWFIKEGDTIEQLLKYALSSFAYANSARCRWALVGRRTRLATCVGG